jgi:hypothetical protein
MNLAIDFELEVKRKRKAKGIIENHFSLDVIRWQREELLCPRSFFQAFFSQGAEVVEKIGIIVESEQVILSFRNSVSDEWNRKTQTVELQTTPCYFGGSRQWFLCPSKGCGKRVAKLYFSGSHFACRHCLDIHHQSQHEARHDRLARKAHKLRERLGWPRGFIYGIGERPKGMHRKTFERLSMEAEAVTEQCMAAARSRFKFPV